MPPNPTLLDTETMEVGESNNKSVEPSASPEEQEITLQETSTTNHSTASSYQIVSQNNIIENSTHLNAAAPENNNVFNNPEPQVQTNSNSISEATSLHGQQQEQQHQVVPEIIQNSQNNNNNNVPIQDNNTFQQQQQQNINDSFNVGVLHGHQENIVTSTPLTSPMAQPGKFRVEVGHRVGMHLVGATPVHKIRKCAPRTILRYFSKKW